MERGRERENGGGERNEERAKALPDVTPNMASNRGWSLSYKHRVNKMAGKITFTNSCPQRDFLIAFRNGIHAARLVILTISVVFLGKDCTSIIDLFTGKLNLARKL